MNPHPRLSQDKLARLRRELIDTAQAIESRTRACRSRRFRRRYRHAAHDLERAGRALESVILRLRQPRAARSED